MPRRITETVGVAPQPVDRLRYRVRVIEGPRWGSSGYYGTDALDSAVDALTPGTKVFLDHPSATEDRDRPERSLRDLAGRIIGPITRESDGIYAVLKVHPHWANVVASLAEDGDLDMSIRALAEFHPGEAEGRHGPIIEQITAFLSVDLVTEAGAGGRVLELIESAKAVTEAPTNDLRQQLSAALKSAYAAGENEYLWITDFDPDKSLVWFEQSDRTYQQAYRDERNAVTLTGEPVEVVARTTYHPVGQVDETKQEESMPTMDEAEHRRLTEAANRAATLETELAEAKQAKREAEQTAAAAEDERKAAVEAAAGARADKAEALIATADLPDPAKDRLRESFKANPDADVAGLISAEVDYLNKVAPTRDARFGSDPANESKTPVARVRTTNAWGRPLSQKGA